MSYSKYGESFRTLRKQHKKTLEYFESLGISKGTLSQFENGKTLLSFDKLDMALQKMNVTMTSYILMINNTESEYFIIQFKEIENAFVTRNKEKLKQIYHDNVYYEIEEDYFIALAAKACYEELTDEEKTQLEIFFNNCEMWSRYELNLLINTMPQLDQTLVFSIISQLRQKKYDYLRIRREYRPLFARVLAKGALQLIAPGEQNEAKGLIKYLKELPSTLEVTEKVMGMYLEGCFIYKFEDTQMGNKIVRRSLRILLDIEATDLKNMLEFYYKKMINGKAKGYLLIK